MITTPELVEKVAKLARIELSEEEKKRFSKEFEKILELFSEIEQIETKNFEQAKIKNIFRKDIPEKSLNEKDTFSNTIHREGDFFKGPKIK